MLATYRKHKLFSLQTGLAACFALLLCAITAPALAQQAAETAAQGYLQEALAHEMYGRNTERTNLLTAAVTAAPELQAARWQLGQLEVDGQWLGHADFMEQARANPRLAEYQERRAAAADTLEDQLALARWCGAYGLADRGRLHWQTVLSLDPSNQEAAGRLGLIEYEGRWMTREMRAAIRLRRVQLGAADREWRPQLEQCRQAILTGDAAQRAEALEQLHSFNDEWAIPTLEELYMQQGGELALISIEILSQLDHPWATESLAFLAMTTEETAVRRCASEALRNRPLFTFVPQLLEGLQVSTAPRARTTSYSTVSPGTIFTNGSRNGVGDDSQAGIQVDREARDDTRERSLTTFRPTRRQKANMVAVLQTVAGRPDLTEPNQWQAWWSDYIFTELGYQQDSGNSSPGINAKFVHSDPFPSLQTEDYGASPPRMTDAEARKYMRDLYAERREERLEEELRLYRQIVFGSCECFVAGTLVWTETGARPIEQIEIGDRVLAKDVETGELSFQLVTTRTERTAPEMVTLVTTQETIVTTPGHLFWVSGEGWKMARELYSGDILHGVAGADIVSEVIFETEPRYVYNLVVDEANTYFVGASQLLVHDATSRQWSQALVPGLVLIEE